MKLSIIISVLILAIAGIFGWKGHQRLSRVRIEHQSVVDEAQALGISIDSLGKDGVTRKPLERARTDREAEAKKLAVEIIAFAKRMKEFEENGGQQDDEFQKEIMLMMRRFLDLDGMQLKALIADLKVSDEIDDEMRQEIIGFSVMMLANESPETALQIYTETSDILDMDGIGEHVISSAISRLAERDPFAAMDWIRENGRKNPDLISEEVKAAVVSGAARQDPAVALQLVDELELKDSHQAMAGIARSADTPEKRIRLLETLRGLDSDGSGEIRRSALRALGSQVVDDGFDASMEWLKEAEMNKGELGSFSGGLSYDRTQEDTGRWMEWVEAELPEHQLENKAGNMMREWTRADFEAAGTWLNDVKEGPLKGAAIKSYAETVAPYEPEAAAQWAMTLPGGEERDKVIGNIHKEWKKKDEKAAAAFAAEHGIE